MLIVNERSCVAALRRAADPLLGQQGKEGDFHGSSSSEQAQFGQEGEAVQKAETPLSGKTIIYPTEEDIRAIADDPNVNQGEATQYIQGGREKVEAAIGRIKGQYYGVELFPTLFDKAAALLHSIATTHPLENANKRVATEAAMRFLGDNGLFLDDDFDEDEVIEVVLGIVTGSISQDQLRDWLKGKFFDAEN